MSCRVGGILAPFVPSMVRLRAGYQRVRLLSFRSEFKEAFSNLSLSLTFKRSQEGMGRDFFIFYFFVPTKRKHSM